MSEPTAALSTPRLQELIQAWFLKPGRALQRRPGCQEDLGRSFPEEGPSGEEVPPHGPATGQSSLSGRPVRTCGNPQDPRRPQSAITHRASAFQAQGQAKPGEPQGAFGPDRSGVDGRPEDARRGTSSEEGDPRTSASLGLRRSWASGDLGPQAILGLRRSWLFRRQLRSA